MTLRLPRSAFALSLGLGLGLGVVGCGHTEEEWQWQLDKLARAQGDLASTQNKLDQVARATDARRAEAPSAAPLSAALEERERAIADFKVRARAIELAAAQAEGLRGKLNDLAPAGVTVSMRRSRLTITVPGDFLFQPFRGDQLTRPGQKALQKIAQVIRTDPQLVNRNWEIIGHNDDKKLEGGTYRDALGVSLMHAREVLSNVVGQGGFVTAHWSAAAYGDADPVAPNDTNDNRAKNRRVEIVLVTPGDEPGPLPAAASQPPPTAPVPSPAPSPATSPLPDGSHVNPNGL
jgi:chemotaxis protein MotB